MASDDIPVALIGYGTAGEVFHAPLIAATAGLRLDTVVTADPARAARATARYGSRVLASADAVWDRRPGLVVVATPNDSHVPLGLAAVSAGIPVVVDKPLARTASEARELVTAARQAGVLLSVFHNRRWDGDLLTVRRLLAAGRLGAVTRFESRFERWRPQTKPGWREASLARGGGLLLDLGSHLVDQALLLFGPADRVYAEIDRRRPGAAVEDDVLLALRHAGGVRSTLWTSAVAALRGPRFRVLGSTAAYVRFGLDGQEEGLRAGASPADPDFGTEPAAHWGRLGTEERAEVVATERGAYPAFYAGMLAALRGEGPPPVDPRAAVAVAEVLDAARRSAEQGAPVTLPVAGAGVGPGPGVAAS